MKTDMLRQEPKIHFDISHNESVPQHRPPQARQIGTHGYTFMRGKIVPKTTLARMLTWIVRHNPRLRRLPTKLWGQSVSLTIVDTKHNVQQRRTQVSGRCDGGV